MQEIIITLTFTVYHGGFLKWLVSKETWDKIKDDKLILSVYLMHLSMLTPWGGGSAGKGWGFDKF